MLNNSLDKYLHKSFEAIDYGRKVILVMPKKVDLSHITYNLFVLSSRNI